MKTISREQTIEAIRAKLMTLTDDTHSICEVATRKNLFCRGFSQWTTGELRKRYGWIVANRPAVRRNELEDLANRWQIARQMTLGQQLACDVQTGGCETHPTCMGWDAFSDDQLAEFHRELLGEEIEVAVESARSRDEH